MRKIFASLVLICLVAFANAQELKWQTDFNAAVQMSIKSKKPIMMFFTGSDWCGWCKRLQAEVFKSADFDKWVNENVIPMELDFPRSVPQSEELKKQNAMLSGVLPVRGYPTVWFVTPEVKADGNVNLQQLGSLGYQAGGTKAWIQSVQAFLPTAPQLTMVVTPPQSKLAKPKKKSKKKK
jgi:protein disulfide-isomerase